MKRFKIIFLVCLFGMGIYSCSENHSDDFELISEEVMEASIEEVNSDFEEIAEPEPVYTQRVLDSSFKEKYSGNQFDYYREPPPIKEPPFKIKFSPALIKTLIYVLLAVALVTIVYFIIQNMGGFSFSGRKQKIRFDSTEGEEENPEDITQNDFGLLIQKAKNEQNYRLAVRYYYLWILQKLTDKELIKWNKDKTNYEYYLELNQKPIQNDFWGNTYIYDYIWYGNFDITSGKFKQAEDLFQKTLNKLK